MTGRNALRGFGGANVWKPRVLKCEPMSTYTANAPQLKAHQPPSWWRTSLSQRPHWTDPCEVQCEPSWLHWEHIIKLADILKYNYNDRVFPRGIAYYPQCVPGALVKYCLILNAVKLESNYHKLVEVHLFRKNEKWSISSQIKLSRIFFFLLKIMRHSC